MLSWVVLLIALAGWGLWRGVGPRDAQLGRTGEIIFACGFFVTCLRLAGYAVHLLPPSS